MVRGSWLLLPSRRPVPEVLLLPLELRRLTHPLRTRIGGKGAAPHGTVAQQSPAASLANSLPFSLRPLPETRSGDPAVFAQPRGSQVSAIPYDDAGCWLPPLPALA